MAVKWALALDARFQEVPDYMHKDSWVMALTTDLVLLLVALEDWGQDFSEETDSSHLHLPCPHNRTFTHTLACCAFTFIITCSNIYFCGCTRI